MALPLRHGPCLQHARAAGDARQARWHCCAARPRRRRNVPLARAPETSQSSTSPSKQGALAPEMLAMFQETQKNMVELNRSRLQALDDLRAAQRRIADLETRLEAAESSEAAWSLSKSAAPSSSSPADSPRPGPQAAAAASPPQSTAAPAQALPPQPPSQAAPPQQIISISYSTGWHRAFLHFNVDGKGWTSVPGVPMQRSGDGPNTLDIVGSSIEFVINNGENGWDTPDPYGGGKKNYTIDAPGQYRLKSGKIQRTG